MATNYYVIVSQLKDEGKISEKLCGRLWATRFDWADIEAGRYREELNHNADLEWLMGDWYVVNAVPESVARTYKSFDKFKNRRVNSKPTTLPKKMSQPQQK